MIKQPELGQNIREAREIQGISVIQLCKIVGIKKTSYYDIESGVNNPRKPTLDSICRVLNISPDTLEPFESAWNDFPEKVGRDELSGVMLHLYRPEDIKEWLNKYEKEIREIPKK